MIPRNVEEYLKEHDLPFERLEHPHTVSAQRLAQLLHVSGHMLAKTVVIEADGERWMLVLPATENVDEDAVRKVMNAHSIRLLSEEEFTPMFPGCDKGAEPPFGRLFGLPVLCDARLAERSFIVVRGGSHELALRIPWPKYTEMERPGLASFGVPVAVGPGYPREVERGGAPSVAR
jgi:Ala-tRNA(Pro) deacylase